MSLADELAAYVPIPVVEGDGSGQELVLPFTVTKTFFEDVGEELAKARVRMLAISCLGSDLLDHFGIEDGDKRTLYITEVKGTIDLRSALANGLEGHYEKSVFSGPEDYRMAVRVRVYCE